MKSTHERKGVENLEDKVEPNYLIKVKFVDFTNIEIEPTERILKCDQCNKTFTDDSNAREHLLTHTSNECHICKYCNKKFVAIILLTEHLKSHQTKVEKYKNCFECTHCQKQFEFIDHLLNHFNVNCKNFLNIEKTTIEHERTLSPELDEANASQDFGNKSSSEYIKQEEKEFLEKQDYEKIKRVVKGKKRGRKKKYIKSTVKNERKLRIRCIPKPKIKDNVESNLYMCNYCSTSFDNAFQYETHLHDHKNLVHGNINVKGHYTSVKIVNDKKECTLCGISFASIESSLFDHVTNAHPEIKISKLCLFCGKLFATKADLERHIRCHTGEKPFMCTECPYSCSRPDNLKKHLLLHIKTV